jgi:hypothetical protein
VSELLARAFAALGEGPTRRELELVADALREADDEETWAALEDPDAVAQIAYANNSHGLVALDLRVVLAYGIDELTRRSTYDPDVVRSPTIEMNSDGSIRPSKIPRQQPPRPAAGRPRTAGAA